MFLLVLSANICMQSQSRIWGSLPGGGSTESGQLFEIGLDGSDFSIAYDFMRYNGEDPKCKLLLADNNKLYGTANLGFENGILFEYDPETEVYRIIHNFNIPGSTNPMTAEYSSLIQASNGKIYGLTQDGGSDQSGVLFEYDLSMDMFEVKHDFDRLSHGRRPKGILLEAADGKLYGIAEQGGEFGKGTLFRYDPSTEEFTLLRSFNEGLMGGLPQGGLIQASNGLLYGMTYSGGSGNGVIYVYDYVSNLFTHVHDFDGSSGGGKPYGRLLQASDGLLYGLTSKGGTSDAGIIFSFDPATYTFAKKKNISNIGGENPRGEFIQAPDGFLYATTFNGGIENGGILFRYDPVSNDDAKLLDFYGEEFGANPGYAVTIVNDGTLFGVTDFYGEHYEGVLFQYDPSLGTYHKRFDFKDAPEGSNAEGDLLQASDGMVYGLTRNGGEYSDGTIFRIDPVSLNYEVVFSFDGEITGSSPDNGLIQTPDGLMYGSAYGGIHGFGVMFVFDPATLEFTVLHHFDETESGKFPNGNLLLASNGKLYGVAKSGGINAVGTLFEFDIESSTFTKLFDFKRLISGAYPRGSMTQAANGKIYGVTESGGSFEKGVLYAYNPQGNNFEVKLEFDGTNKGAYPRDKLVEYESNILYGVTGVGGINNDGVIYQYNTETDVFTKLMNIDEPAIGAGPGGSFILASNGNFYGNMQAGAPAEPGHGSIYEYDPETNSLSSIYDFETYQHEPGYNRLLEVVDGPGIFENAVMGIDISVYPNPAGDFIRITSEELSGEVEISIESVDGKAMLEGLNTADISDLWSNSIDISDLPPGIYVISIFQNNRSGSVKFIKN